jgi:prolyl 4-hydroxylase
MEIPERSPEVARARKLDAEGRHDDAINQLAAAAQRGDVDATTQLAKRIIIGDRAPRLWRQGIGLLQDAVKLGGAEAADRLAVIAASGIAGPPDWRAALGLLVLAAERGWAPARAQLDVLASASRDGSAPPASARPPRAVVDDVDLRRLLVPRAGSMIHQDPRICIFPGFLGDAACAWLIDRARGRLKRALVYDVEKQTDLVDDSRTNSAAVFDRMAGDLVHLMVQTRISAVCGQPVSHLEAPTVLHYAVGEEIKNHYDFVDPTQPSYAEDIRRFGYRTLTFLVYLNDGYAGGETVFPKLGVSHSGTQGEGILFDNTLRDGQADVRTLHGGRPPSRGEKWVFSQFVRNRPELIDD